MNGRLLQAVGRGAVAALVWGVASAAVTRLLMRGVALTKNDTPAFTVFGTVGIATIYVVALLPGAVALAVSAGRWPWLLYGGGIAFLLFGAVSIGASSVAFSDDMTAARWLVLVVLVTAMAVVYAAQFRLVARWARRRPTRALPADDEAARFRPARSEEHRAAPESRRSKELPHG